MKLPSCTQTNVEPKKGQDIYKHVYIHNFFVNVP